MTTVLTREGPVDMVAIRQALGAFGVLAREAVAHLTEHELDVTVQLGHAAGMSKAELIRRLDVSERVVNDLAKLPPPVDRSGEPIILGS